jgi:glycerophosphoryl diester phosphodiesterase
LPSLPLSEFYTHHPLNFAHRGARKQAPENTLPAFERAAELKADGIELDVQLTADNEIVVYHDEEIGRTSDGSGRIREWSLYALKELDAGGYFSATFAGTRIPTLGEVFEAVGTQLKLNIEIKPFVQRHNAVPLVADLIRRHGMESRVIVSSFNHRILRAMRKHAPDIPRGFLIDGDTSALLRHDFALRYLIGPYHARHPYLQDTDPNYVSWAHDHGYRVNVWTVNEKDDIRRMIDIGVDMIISDVPDIVRTVLEQVRQ